jgi:hypothetical protein
MLVFKGTVDDTAKAFLRIGDLSPVPLKRDAMNRFCLLLD